MKEQRGQSTVEYAVVITVIIAALLAMQIYIKRGAMGKLKDATDQIGEQFTPNTATFSFNRIYNSDRTEVLNPTGLMNTTITSEVQFRNGTETRSDNLANETLF